MFLYAHFTYKSKLGKSLVIMASIFKYKVSESFNIISYELIKTFECKWKFVCFVFTAYFSSENHLKTYSGKTTLDIICYFIYFFKGVFFECKILALG